MFPYTLGFLPGANHQRDEVAVWRPVLIGSGEHAESRLRTVKRSPVGNTRGFEMTAFCWESRCLIHFGR